MSRASTLVRAVARGTSGRPLVRELVRDRVTVEHGDLDAARSAQRIALLVHYAPHPEVSLSFRTLVRQFAESGYQVVVVSSSPAVEQLRWGGLLPLDTVVLRKPNVGYDFGSWSAGMDLIPEVASAPYVIMANDSCLGPFQHISGLLGQFESAESDVWGLTSTTQYFRHLQSYFLGYRGGVLAERPLARFWADVRQEPTKWDVIRRNELGLNRLLLDEGYTVSAAFHGHDVVGAGENPVIRGWWRLLEQGFPFLKREIVTSPDVAPRSEYVHREIEALFGLDLDEWL